MCVCAYAYVSINVKNQNNFITATISRIDEISKVYKLNA